MGYVIRRNEDGKFVARPGSERSYTNKLEDARVYPSRDAARADLCIENEHVVSLESIFAD